MSEFIPSKKNPTDFNNNQKLRAYTDVVKADMLNNVVESQLYTQNTAETAEANSSTALSKSKTAETNSSNALSKSKTAETNSSTALSKSETAINTANSALNKSKTAETNSSNALSKSKTAETNSATALSKASIAESNSNNAVNTANRAKSIAEGIDGKATNALSNSQTAINTANDAKDTAGQALAKQGTSVEVNKVIQEKIAFTDDPQKLIDGKQPMLSDNQITNINSVPKKISATTIFKGNALHIANMTSSIFNYKFIDVFVRFNKMDVVIRFTTDSPSRHLGCASLSEGAELYGTYITINSNTQLQVRSIGYFTTGFSWRESISGSIGTYGIYKVVGYKYED